MLHVDACQEDVTADLTAFQPEMTGSSAGGASGWHDADGVIQLCKIHILHTQCTRHQQYVSDTPVGQRDAGAKMEGRNQITNHTISKCPGVFHASLNPSAQTRCTQK